MKQDNKKKIANKVFGWFLFILFVTFVTLYISQATGYYEYSQAKKLNAPRFCGRGFLD